MFRRPEGLPPKTNKLVPTSVKECPNRADGLGPLGWAVVQLVVIVFNKWSEESSLRAALDDEPPKTMYAFPTKMALASLLAEGPSPLVLIRFAVLLRDCITQRSSRKPNSLSPPKIMQSKPLPDLVLQANPRRGKNVSDPSTFGVQ